MKFSELTERQASAIKELYLKVLDSTASESRKVAHEGLRLLLVGNGAGIAVLTSLSGGYVTAGGKFSDLMSPVIVFLIGLMLSGLSYIPLIAVSNTASQHLGTMIDEFLRDTRDMETIQGYGFNAVGRILMMLLIVLSLVCLVAGMVLTIGVFAGR